jgi:hypothetical protein
VTGSRRRVRRLLLVAAAAALGLVAGGTLAAGVQGGTPGGRDGTDGAGGPGAGTPGGDEVAAGTVPVPEGGPGVLLAWTPDGAGLDPALEGALRARPGVTGTSLVRGDPVDLVGSRTVEGAAADRIAPGWAVPLDAVAIVPADHAPFAPVGDRAAVDQLRPGQALLGRTAAGLRGIGAGGTLELAGGARLPVAAVVDDAAIGGAEVAVVAPDAHVRTARFLLVAHDGDRASVERAVRDGLPAGTAVRFRAPGETPILRHGDAVLTQAQVKDRFGEFTYRPATRPGGDARAFEQDPAWTAEHIVATDLPIVGRARCHRAVVDAIAGALAEVEEAGLAGLVTPGSFAGCWSPRRAPSRSRTPGSSRCSPAGGSRRASRGWCRTPPTSSSCGRPSPDGRAR